MTGRMTVLARRRAKKPEEQQRRDEDYATMTPEEREQAKDVWSEGTLGEADVYLEHEFDRIEDADDGRPQLGAVRRRREARRPEQPRGADGERQQRHARPDPAGRPARRPPAEEVQPHAGQQHRERTGPHPRLERGVRHDQRLQAAA